MVANRRWRRDYKLERGIYSTATGMYHDPSADLHARGREHCPSCAAGTAENVSFRACVILSRNPRPHHYAPHAPDVIACLGSILHRLSPLLHGVRISPLHSRWAVRWRDYQAEFGCKSIGCVCGGAVLGGYPLPSCYFAAKLYMLRSFMLHHRVAASQRSDFARKKEYSCC